jgi:hypothetical protein
MNGMAETLAMKAFAKANAKMLIKDSIWEQLSNRNDTNAVGSAGANMKLPKDVIHVISGITATATTRSITQAMVGRLKGDFVGGAQVAEGRETTPDLYQMQCYWNVWRKPYKLFNGDDAESNYQSWYAGAELKTGLAKDYASEVRDYFYHSAIIDGSSPLLNDNQYWQDHEVADFQTAPLTKRLHPMIFFKGQTGAITRNANYATDIQAVSTALKVLAPADGFDLSCAEHCIELARKRVRPLSYKAGGQNVKYIVMLSEVQATQLAKDSDWKTMFREGDTRGLDNRSISGILGVWRETLFLANPRAPLFNLSVSTASISYLKPSTVSTDASTLYFDGEQSLDRTVKGATTVETGTCEMAIILGAGAIVNPMPQDLKYGSQKKDYDFREGFIVTAKEGQQRTDFKDKAGVYTTYGSLLYVTATPARLA